MEKNLIEIEKKFAEISTAVFTTQKKFSYNELTQKIIDLAEKIKDYEGETENMWYLGGSGSCALVDFMTGAYWHYSEYHAGQTSIGYAAISTLGRIYDPGMESIDKDNMAYIDLGIIAEKYLRS